MKSVTCYRQRLLAFLRIQRLSIRQGLLRLRKNSIGIVLMAVLALSIGEPLMCVIHCDLWLPLYHASRMQPHQHVHTPGMAMQASSDASQQLVSEPSSGAIAVCQTWLNSHSGTAVPTPPLPIHEISIALIVLLAFVRGSEHYRQLPVFTPPESPPPNHFRPPILRTT